MKSGLWDAQDQALMDNDPTNAHIWAALKDEDLGAKHLGGNANDYGHKVQEQPTRPTRNNHNGANTATAGLLGGGLGLGLMAPVIGGAAMGGGGAQQAGGGGQAA